MFLTCDFPVFGSGVETGVPKVFLKKPQPVARIVQFYRMGGKGVAKAMWTYVVDSTSFWIYQLWKACFFSAVPDYLPGPVAIDAKDESLLTSENRATTLDVFFKHA